jgi:hypothetical protein
LAPFFAKANAAARPIPVSAPVMRATLSFMVLVLIRAGEMPAMHDEYARTSSIWQAKYMYVRLFLQVADYIEL